VVLLAGPNGAGKTTLLRLLAGLLPLASGTAIVLGHDLSADRHTVRAELALVGHAPGAYDDLTVRENVRFWVRAGGGRVSDADAVVEQLGLSRLAGVAFGRLSAGQQRRTGLAVALARRPRLLLLDEPHAGLDATGRDLLDELLKSSAREGRTVLLVSHELDRARALADREVTIVAGAIRPVGESAPSPTEQARSATVASGKHEGLSDRTQPDQLPAPERVSVPRPDGGGAR
jgi:heme ABC exporter ATP-binding subunit CcmA